MTADAFIIGSASLSLSCLELDSTGLERKRTSSLFVLAIGPDGYNNRDATPMQTSFPFVELLADKSEHYLCRQNKKKKSFWLIDFSLPVDGPWGNLFRLVGSRETCQIKFGFQFIRQ